MPKDGRNLRSPTSAKKRRKEGRAGQESTPLSASFPRENRLSGRTAIRNTIFRGAKISGKWLELSVADGSSTRFAISVPGKFGKAVRRNRVKRVIREFLRNNKSLWPQNKWVIIRLIKDPGNDQEITGELKRTISKIE